MGRIYEFFSGLINTYKEQRLERTIKIYFNLLFDIALTRFKYSIVDLAGYDEYFVNQLLKEIERRLILTGMCGIIKKPNTKKINIPIAVYVYGYTPTWYFDFFKNFTWFSPVDAGECYNPKNIFIQSSYDVSGNTSSGIVGFNDNTHDGLFELIYHYAELLAHLSISIRSVSINMREPSAIPSVSTSKLSYVINNFKAKILGGDFMPVTDLGLSTVKWVDNRGVNSNTLSELIESRKKLLLEFYNLLGVKTGYEKKGNVVVDELNANDEMLQLNFADMIKHRQELLGLIKDEYGINITVSLNTDGGGYDESIN